MSPLLQLQKLPGKGDGGWKKSVFVSFFCWPIDREFVEQMRFGASYSTSNNLLLVARHILTTGLQKKTLKLAVLKSQIHCHRFPLWRKYALEKQPRDLRDARQKSRNLTTPPEPPNIHTSPNILARQSSVHCPLILSVHVACSRLQRNKTTEAACRL